MYSQSHDNQNFLDQWVPNFVRDDALLVCLSCTELHYKFSPVNSILQYLYFKVVIT